MRVDFKSAPTARRIHKRGQQKKAHYTTPGATGRLMQLESRLEASAAIVMGLDPRVADIRSQPVCFDLATGRAYPSKEHLRLAAAENGNRPVEYTPDFKASLPKGPVFIEVKHSALIEMNPKILGYPGVLARYGHRLIIIDDSCLPETFVRNMRLLNISKSAVPKGPDTAKLRKDTDTGANIADLVKKGHSQRNILAALAHGEVTCDVQDERISQQTVIHSSKGLPRHLMELPLGLQ